MKKEFIITRGESQFVLYAGLLDEAHRQGLKSITTHLLQIPNESNGMVAICRAVVETEKGIFSGIGDASPQNVNRQMVHHIIRMAECVPLRAQILTRTGWKRYDELVLGEDVLAYDVEQDLCVWTPLEDIRVYLEPYETVRLSARSFNVVCTPDHSWAVQRNGSWAHANLRVLRKTCEFTTSDSIIVAAPAEGGDHPLLPEEAALLGWLATDGTLREQIVRAGEHVYGPYVRASIVQAKPQYLSELRELVTATRGMVAVIEPRQHDFGTYVSDCLPSCYFNLNAGFTRQLLQKAGIQSWSDLPRLVTRLTPAARAAMLDAMLKGDGTLHRGNSWVFGQKQKPGVLEAFEILATLEGYALGKPRLSSVGDVPVLQVRRSRLINVNSLTVCPDEPQPVWCPATRYGTWVMRLDGYITITGNTRAKARALRDAVNVGVAALEELGDLEEEVVPASRARLNGGNGNGHPTNGSAREERAGAPATSQVEPEPAQAREARELRETRPAHVAPQNADAPATPRQIETIERLAKATGRTVSTENLTRRKASELIASLTEGRFGPARQERGS
jgi:hypothetical protein